MGIISQARTAVRSSIASFRATNPTRGQLRRFVAASVDAGNEWLAKHDAQESAAPADFAASKPAAFSTFVDALPPVTLGADPDGD